MKVLFFSSVASDLESRLLNIMTSMIPAGDIETFQEVETIERRLLQPHSAISLVVLVVSDRPELDMFGTMRHMLFDLHLLLLLPERIKDETAIAVAHSLQPRFVGLTDGNLAVFSGVLRKTLTNKMASVHPGQRDAPCP